ncbi:DUF5677 domain-containing protein [Oceanicoccus sp. KOV_DT_Chl]|uniref:DUF5677 domain-containing protein n=1 Tax=Oceanicoccus sp. KOV_DT_Chl TaxID=1904639 RepID=UPI000C79C128|nr:DUF5677 domain-containing protein [Oceanicoccus sp. KOV_DT_Chl]
MSSQGRLVELQEANDAIAFLWITTISEKHVQDKTQYKESFSALVGLLTAINGMADVITDLKEEHQRYSSVVLYRSLIEHFLKSTYITVKAGSERSDQVGFDYNWYCRYTEALQYGKGIKESLELTHKVKSKMNIKRIAREYFDYMEGVSERKIDKLTSSFSYKNIIRYISSHKSGIVGKDSPLFSDMIKIYPSLSSYVHGGVSAVSDMNFKSFDDKNYLHDIPESSLLLCMFSKASMLSLLGLESKNISEVGKKASEIFLSVAED